MRTLFWLLTLAALAIGATMLGRLSDGYVLWVMPPWRAELSFNLFVLLQLLILIAAYLLLRLIFNTLKLPKVVTAFRERRARQRTERIATEALRSFWEGRYGHALKSAEKVATANVKVSPGETASRRIKRPRRGCGRLSWRDTAPDRRDRAVGPRIPHHRIR